MPSVPVPQAATPVDLLGAVPTPAPRLTSGALTASQQTEAGCGDLGPDGADLAKHLEIQLPGQHQGAVL
jgi:hypothetical protein